MRKFILPILCLLVFLQHSANASTPVDQKPEFVGDFFIFENDTKESDFDVLSTQIEMRALQVGVRSFEARVKAEYLITNHSDSEYLYFALIGESVKVYCDSQVVLGHRSIRQDLLPEAISKHLNTGFDHYHENSVIPISTFRIALKTGDTRKLQIIYSNISQAWNSFDDVLIFHFWQNPIFKGDFKLNCVVSEALVITNNTTDVKPADGMPGYSAFTISKSRDDSDAGLVKMRFPLSKLDSTAEAQARTTYFIPGVLVGLLTSAVVLFLWRAFALLSSSKTAIKADARIT